MDQNLSTLYNQKKEMVEYNNQLVGSAEPSFINIPRGQDTTKIPGTFDASLLTLPTLNLGQEHKLIACAGPKATTLSAFWKDVVLGQGVKLIVNLCSNVGSNRSSTNLQYWPKEFDQEILSSDNKIRVNLLDGNQYNETLMIYKLYVEELIEREKNLLPSITACL